MTTVIHRDQALKAIAGHIADRDAFVVLVPPAMLDTVTHALRRTPQWRGYIDNGTGIILRADAATATALMPLMGALGIPTAAVLTVPKTVPASVLGEALGQHIPADGSQDIIGIHDGGPLIWPLLFVDALALVDPAAAAQLRALDIATAS
jgi:hypothetical protein